MLKVKVSKGNTLKQGDNFFKTGYELEEETSDPDVTKQILEQKIDVWLNNKPVETSSSTEPKPNTCKYCGKPVKAPYKQCYECFQQHRNG